MVPQTAINQPVVEMSKTGQMQVEVALGCHYLTKQNEVGQALPLPSLSQQMGESCIIGL